MKTVLRSENVSKEFFVRKGLYGGTKINALNDVSVSVRDKEILGIVGASGSGKSTLAKIMVLLYRPTSGKVMYNEENVSNLSGRALKKYRGDVQMVFQDPYASLDPFHSVGWHIKRPLVISKYNGNMEERIDELLEMVKLNPASYFKNKYPNQISGGQRQRVYIARVLALNPKIIVADEPVSMLDVSLRIEILDLFSKIRDNFGISIVYITHDLNTVSMITDRIYVLKGGIVVEEGDTESILKSPRSDYTRKLIEAAPDPYKRL